MVVLLNVTVKTIRGEEFTIGIDRDADTLGLKVQIWEQRGVAIENQRLVFAGRELNDEARLNSVGVSDGATIFLVESGVPQAAAQPQASYIHPAQNPQYAPTQPQQVSMVPMVQQQPVAVVIPPPQNVRRQQVVGYEPLDPTVVANELKNSTYDLARYVRYYTIFLEFLLVVGAAMCRHGGHMLIWIFVTLLGWVGSRNLNRCNIGLFSVQVFLTALVLIAGPTIALAHGYAPPHHAWLVVIPYFLGILHLLIFASLMKLMGNIRKMTADNRKEVRDRIAARSVFF